MELKIESTNRLSELLTVLSAEGYSYSVETIYDPASWNGKRIKYYSVTIKEE